jgi:thiol-disulfide isomerase/thioredoxin
VKLFIPILILLLYFSGCIKEENATKQRVELDVSYKDKISVIDEVWLKNKIENRNGKILFVNFWASWCVPCVEEFPELVKIYNEHKNSKVDFLSVSVDLPSDIETKVKPFLTEQSADFSVVVVEEKKSDEVINLINPEWNGAVPVTVIYDKNGKRKEFISEAKDYEFFNNSIKRIIND